MPGAAEFTHTPQYRDTPDRCTDCKQVSTTLTFKLMNFLEQRKNTSLQELQVWTGQGCGETHAWRGEWKGEAKTNPVLGEMLSGGLGVDQTQFHPPPGPARLCGNYNTHIIGNLYSLAVRYTAQLKDAPTSKTS